MKKLKNFIFSISILVGIFATNLTVFATSGSTSIDAF